MRQGPAKVRRHYGRAAAAGILLALSLGLAGCGGGWIGDHLPHAVGGLPKDAPPRPGAPGYEEWLEKVQGHAPKEPGEKPSVANLQQNPQAGPK